MRVVEKNTLHILEEQREPVGVKTLYDLWLTEGGERETYFMHFLEQQRLGLVHSIPSGCIMVISGMATSDIGLRELPYAPLPAGIKGEGFLVYAFRHPDYPFEIRLVSGLRTGNDIMRGEEAQVVGLSGEIEAEQRTLLVMPGTHSKHVYCHKNEILDFCTFFTGELFYALSHHTILKGAVNTSDVESAGDWAFEEGVQASLDGKALLHTLFHVRAWDKLGKRDPIENYHYLSGLLIGSELAALSGRQCDRILVCAGAGLGKQYARAIAVSNLSGKTKIIPEDIVEAAAIRGHAVLLERNEPM